MFALLSLPITLTSIILYLFLSFFGNEYWVWVLGFLLSIFLLTLVFKRNLAEILDLRKFLTLKNLSLVSLILLFVFCKAYVLSPLVLTKKTNSFEHIQITDVGDYYKHTFVVNSLRLDGIPPGHPYFPMAKLSYYYGYYLIPAAISQLFAIFPSYAFYGFVLITDILGLLIIFRIFNQHLKTYAAKLLSLTLLITGAGISVLPQILSKFPPGVFSIDLGFQALTIYKTFLFNPQHFFAACLTVGLLHYLIFEKPKFFYTSLTTSFILLSSFFVGWTFILWLLLVFIFYPQKRSLLVLTALSSILLIAPFALGLSDRKNLLYFYQFKPYQFIHLSFGAYFINSFLTFLLQYGPMVGILPIAAILKGKGLIKNNLALILGLSLPFVVTCFIRTPLWNDFSMRGMVPFQLISSLIFVKIMEERGQKWLKVALFLIVVFTVLTSFLGIFLEYSNHWKSRMILHPNVSEFILAVRKLPDSTKLSAVDLDRWVEFIPSLGFKKVLSPYLFDSFDYFVGKLTLAHGNYERLAKDLFIEANTAFDLSTLISEKNKQLSYLHDFFDRYQSDQLILNNQLWVKKDINPWLAAFEFIGVKTRALTGSYTLVDYPSLLEKTSKYQISINEKGKVDLKVIDKQIPLKKGFWYLASCSFEKPTRLHLELEDYYLLFNQEVDGNKLSCVGKIFYLQADENVRLTNNSTVEIVYVFPVDIKTTR